MKDRSDENVAIKREQMLLADYAEREQRKDCEAGLIMRIMGTLRLLLPALPKKPESGSIPLSAFIYFEF